MSETAVPPADPLADLVDRIRAGHRECLAALRTATRQARAVGGLLLEAKEAVTAAGREWLPWVQAHCDFSVAQAQRYMRIADRYAELARKAANPDELTMTEALRLLSPVNGKAGKPAATPKPPKPLPLPAGGDLKTARSEAEDVAFAADSPAAAFVARQAAALARQVIRLAAAKGGLTDEDGDPVDPPVAALAILRQLKQALAAGLVVEAAAPAPADTPRKDAHRANGHARLARV